MRAGLLGPGRVVGTVTYSKVRLSMMCPASPHDRMTLNVIDSDHAFPYRCRELIQYPSELTDHVIIRPIRNQHGTPHLSFPPLFTVTISRCRR
jgi:hypothetical protein